MSFLKLGQARRYTPWLARQFLCSPAAWRMMGSSPCPLVACVEANWDAVHRRLLLKKSLYPLDFEEEDGVDPWLECWKVWLARVAVRCLSGGASEAKSQVGAKATLAATACVEADWDDMHRRLLSEKSQYPLVF